MHAACMLRACCMHAACMSVCMHLVHARTACMCMHAPHTESANLHACCMHAQFQKGDVYMWFFIYYKTTTWSWGNLMLPLESSSHALQVCKISDLYKTYSYYMTFLCWHMLVISDVYMWFFKYYKTTTWSGGNLMLLLDISSQALQVCKISDLHTTYC